MESVLGYIFSTNFIVAILRMATPLILCSMGVLLVRNSGVVCIAFEAMMLAASIGGVLGSAYSQNLFVGLLSGVALSVLFAMIFGVFVLVLKANNMLVSLALNTLGSGGSVFLLYALTGDRGNSFSLPSLVYPTVNIPIIQDIPVLGEILSGHNAMTYVAILSVPLVYVLLMKTPLGLQIRAVGENEHAVESLGRSPLKIRFIALFIAGVFAGLAGTYLSMGYVSAFTRDMVAGRGYIATAAQNLGGFMPVPTFIWALIFGASNAIANAFQAINMPPEFLQMFPYISTILGLLLVGMTINRKEEKKAREIEERSRHLPDDHGKKD